MPTFYDRFVDCAERWPNNVALELQRRDHVESCTYCGTAPHGRIRGPVDQREAVRRAVSRLAHAR